MALQKTTPRVSHYLIYYGTVTPAVIATAKQYPLVIFNPNNASLTRAIVAELQSSGTKVILYLSVGEDLRTTQFFNNGTINYAGMLADSRFVGNGLGPTVDPRTVGYSTSQFVRSPNLQTLRTGSAQTARIWPARVPAIRPMAEWPNGAPIVSYVGPGLPSPGGTGFASYYLNDVGYLNGTNSGKPDFNDSWGTAFVNAGDPSWFNTLQAEQFARDGQYGIDEMLTTTVGAGLGADGLFLDTIDTCGPNPWTSAGSAVETKYEWTAPGFSDFIRRLRQTYPSTIIVQNRGLFFFDRDCGQFPFTTRPYIDYLLFESYYLDSNAEVSPFFDDNRYNYVPKIFAEAQRPDGFQPLALDYRASTSNVPVTSQMVTDAITQSESIAGFRTYLSNGDVADINTVVLTTDQISVGTPAPSWSSTVSASYSDGPTSAVDLSAFPPMSSTQSPRVGLQRMSTTSPSGTSQSGTIYLNWDVALGRDPVDYVAYYTYGHGSLAILGRTLAGAACVDLGPISAAGRGYVPGTTVSVGPFAFEAPLTGLKSGQTIEIIIRACRTDNHSIDDGNMNVSSIQVP